jgi:hypothetical protein
MDFVVSKVAMSICALLVVSVLGGAVGNEVLFKKVDELDSILTDLSITLEKSVYSGCEGNTVWRIPFLSDGQSIDISVRDSSLSARAGERSAVLRPACDVHTWLWNGSALNRTSVEALDANAPSVSTYSGRALEIRNQVVAFENQNRVFAFVRANI